MAKHPAQDHHAKAADKHTHAAEAHRSAHEAHQAGEHDDASAHADEASKHATEAVQHGQRAKDAYGGGEPVRTDLPPDASGLGGTEQAARGTDRGTPGQKR